MKEKLNNLNKADKELVALLEKDIKKLKKSSQKEPWSTEVVCTNEDIKKSFTEKTKKKR